MSNVFRGSHAARSPSTQDIDRVVLQLHDGKTVIIHAISDSLIAEEPSFINSVNHIKAMHVAVNFFSPIANARPALKYYFRLIKAVRLLGKHYSNLVDYDLIV